jgi:uncharacterized protein
MKTVLKYLIKFYQLALGSFIGDCCRFYPSCSNYAIDALEKKSLPKAFFLIIKRLLKCHPFSKGGVDFVP